MIVRIKLYANLDKYLPDGGSRNQADMELDRGARVSSVLGRLGLPPAACHLVLVNGVFLAPSERQMHVLEDGDHLAVWPPVAGGGGKKESGGGGNKDSAGGDPKTKVVDKEMALTHADFFRTLPKALGTGDYKKIGAKVTRIDGDKRLEITLGPERSRQIARLSVPATDVRLEFSGYTEAEAEAALKLFDKMFQKGGG